LKSYALTRQETMDSIETGIQLTQPTAPSKTPASRPSQHLSSHSSPST
jgi:hypothetical protein